MSSNPPHALEITPESELTFALAKNAESSARVTMTLRHSGVTDEHLAFKVKTTQPRRYLVRPNQGLVAPNGTETVSILLVDKDKQTLLQSYARLGQSTLDNSKDKFLVQSCAVSMDFSKKYAAEKKKSAGQKGEAAAQASKEMAEALTSMWNAITSSNNTPVYNKKLHVRHTVVAATTSAASPSAAAASSVARDAAIKPHETSLSSMENMTPEQMFNEVSQLRRKYDELVNFSVNLTAERDILNNTLEQTKRDLNREISKKNTGPVTTNSKSAPMSPSKPSFVSTMVQLLVIATAAFVMGIRMTNEGSVGFLYSLPIVGDMLAAPTEVDTVE